MNEQENLSIHSPIHLTLRTASFLHTHSPNIAFIETVSKRYYEWEKLACALKNYQTSYKNVQDYPKKLEYSCKMCGNS